MKRTSLVMVAIATLLGMSSKNGLCADVAGLVSGVDGNPAAAVRIDIKDHKGNVLSSNVTDKHGQYRITGVAPGSYDFVLEPPAPTLKGGDLAAELTAKGLTINWKLSSSGPALASASEGVDLALAGDPFGYSLGEFASIVALGVGGVAAGVVGGVGAAGGFSGSSSSSTPSSPAL